jgi:hypothetical protein
MGGGSKAQAAEWPTYGSGLSYSASSRTIQPKSEGTKPVADLPLIPAAILSANEVGWCPLTLSLGFPQRSRQGTPLQAVNPAAGDRVLSLCPIGRRGCQGSGNAMPFKVQIGPPQISIHHGQTILITEPDGQINWPSEGGLYFF